ncbi:MAG TPA: Uma2 family endonuclease, partial [Blastocatellia bacterium]|nr:Uma2 family endonuclease [Blastocatellia bacterium]
CGEPEVVNIRGVDALVNPVVIVEVLSPSTENRERGEKFAAYKQIATFEEYLLVEQQVPRITHYLRQGDGAWSSKDLTGMGSAVCLRSTGCELSLAEVYEGVAFNSLE